MKPQKHARRGSVIVRARRPWCARVRFDDERLRGMTPRAWPGIGTIGWLVVWTVVPVGIIASGAGTLIAMHALDLVTLGGAAKDVATTAFALSTGAAVIALSVLFLVGVPRIERRVVAARGRLCPYCAHSVAGRLPGTRRDRIRCTECGREIRERDAVLFWLRQVRRASDP